MKKKAKSLNWRQRQKEKAARGIEEAYAQGQRDGHTNAGRAATAVTDDRATAITQVVRAIAQAVDAAAHVVMVLAKDAPASRQLSALDVKVDQWGTDLRDEAKRS